MIGENDAALPPSDPPPLLSEDELVELATQGWLTIPLPDELNRNLQELFRHSTSFFDQSTDHKGKSYPRSRGTEYGYYEVEGEKEYVTFRRYVHQTSATPSANELEFEQSTATVWRQAATLLHRILCDIARASDLELSVWNDILDGTLTMPTSDSDMTHTLLRVFHYHPSTGHAAAHTDLGLLTLCVGDGHGLQVLDRRKAMDGEAPWVDAPATTNTATILVSETLGMLSNRTMNTGIHRVVGNPEGRNSAVFALRHSSRHHVDLSLFGGDGKIHPSELYKVMEVGKVNINVVKKDLDRQYEAFYSGQAKDNGPGMG